MYLGLGEKDPGSRQCEEMVVKVDLPGVESAADIDLDVKKHTILILTPKHKLSTFLPRPVQEDKGKAQWVSAKQQLRVVLPLVRIEPWEDI